MLSIKKLILIGLFATKALCSPIASENVTEIEVRSASPLELSINTPIPLTATCSGSASHPYDNGPSAIFGDGDLKRAYSAASGAAHEGFPKYFGNGERLNMGDCKGRLNEFPLFNNGLTWKAGPGGATRGVGADRIIIEQVSKKFCSVVTHRGVGNSFQACHPFK